MNHYAPDGTPIINPYAVDFGPGLMDYSPWLLSQTPAFSDISLPSGDLCDLYRSQSAPPCLEQGHNLFCSPHSLPTLPLELDAFSLESSTHDEPLSKEHIPRPPNAFMLYRSYMLKNRGNADPEKRQQNLSRIAGQLWREMSDEDRAVWHKKAAEVHAAHYAKYPNYKFKPNRKGIKSGVKSLKNRGYCQPTQQVIAESSMGPVRRARSRRVYPWGLMREDLLATLETQFPSSASSSPRLSPLHFPPFLPMLSSEGMRGDEHPNAILFRSQLQPQRANALGLELDVSRPPTPGLAEILSDLALDLDATPTAATFKRESKITQAENALSQDGAFLGLEQLRLPYNSTDYSTNYSSPPVHGSVNGYQPTTQSYSCSEPFGGTPPCASDSIFPDFFPLAMPLDYYGRDEWSGTWWMLGNDVDRKLDG